MKGLTENQPIFGALSFCIIKHNKYQWRDHTIKVHYTLLEDYLSPLQCGKNSLKLCNVQAGCKNLNTGEVYATTVYDLTILGGYVYAH